MEPSIPGAEPSPTEPEIPVRAPDAHTATGRLSVAVAIVALAVATFAAWYAAEARRSARLTHLQLGVLQANVDSNTNSPFSSDLYLEYKVGRVIERWAPTIDLRTDNLQSAGQSFMLASMNVSAEPGGTRLTGTVVSDRATDLEMATFEITVLGVSRQFTVRSLAHGGSSRFGVSLPGVVADSARWGQVRYVSSTIRYSPPHQ